MGRLGRWRRSGVQHSARLQHQQAGAAAGACTLFQGFHPVAELPAVVINAFNQFC